MLLKYNMDLTTICNKKICFIISHHDDETLFFGGLLNILHDKNEITIIVVVGIEHENLNYNFEMSIIFPHFIPPKLRFHI